MIAATGGGYFLGQDDWWHNSSPAVVAKIGDLQRDHVWDFSPTQWHHMAAVRSGNNMELYWDGQIVDSFPVGGATPTGNLRFGRDAFDPGSDHGESQFYGLLDDVAIFNRVLAPSELASLAAGPALTGGEPDLVVGFTFPASGGGPSGPMNPPITLSYGATLVDVSATRDGSADQNQFPLASTDFVQVPFPKGETLDLIQGYDSPAGTHKGYASFCWDFVRAGQPQSASQGIPFDSAVFGSVESVQQESVGGTQNPSNYISVHYGDNEFADHLHLGRHTAVVRVGASVNAGERLADVGDTGAPAGAFHLHLGTTNVGESAHTAAGSGFVTVPAPLCNYEVSDDGGQSWRPVTRGIPTVGQWIRRPAESSSSTTYTAVWRPSSDGEIQLYGATYDEFRAKYDELWPQSWRLKLLSVHLDNGTPMYNAAWQPSSDGEIQLYGATYDEFRAKYDELWPQNWRLKLLSVFVGLFGLPIFTAVWQPSSDGEIQLYGATSDEFRAKYDELWPQNWRLKLLSVYLNNGTPMYTAVWQPSSDGERQVYGRSYGDYRATYDGLWARGWRLAHIMAY